MTISATEFFPGFDVEDEKGIYNIDTPSGPDRFPISNREIPTHRWDAFAFRVRQFLSGLNPQRRAEFARRPRFPRLPWIRPASQPDEDYLP